MSDSRLSKQRNNVEEEQPRQEKEAVRIRSPKYSLSPSIFTQLKLKFQYSWSDFVFVCGDFSFRRETREDKERAEAPCEEKQDESQCLPLNLPVFFFFFC